jgi:PAS domain S-box-containing protein
MKIFLKIFITIVLATIVFLTYFTSFIIKNQKKELTKRLHTKIEYLRKINQNTISQLLYDLNNDILLININALFLDEEIVKIVLIDYSHTLNIQKSDKNLGNDLIKDTVELDINGESFGQLSIWYTKDLIKQDIEKFTIDVLKVSILLFILMLLVILFFINKFTNSIKKLTKATIEISSGNLDYKIDIKTNDEIGILANKFDEMKNSLKNRITTINEQLKFQQLLIDSINTPIFIRDTEGLFIDCNNAFTSFYGLSKKEIIGNTMDCILQGKYLTEQLSLEKNLLDVGGFNVYETKLPNKDNELKNIIIYKNTYYDIDNKLKWIIGTYFDITEINKAKKEIEKFNEELQQMVYKRTEQLEKSNEELQKTIFDLNLTQDKLIESEKMASLGGLVAGVAHEINTPVGISLTAITHFVELNKNLRDNFEKDSLSEDGFKEFIKTSKELAQLINSNLVKTAHLIRSFKQVAVDQTNEEKRKFDLKEYTNETIFSLSNIIKKAQLKVIVDIDDNIVIDSYPGSFSQIITNLITNSINHAYKDKKSGIININAKRYKDGIKLIYKDDGVGIDKETLPKIFEPFFTTNREKGGTGLGLNIIYNIITRNLNGQISCNSENNQGVEFIIIIDKV